MYDFILVAILLLITLFECIREIMMYRKDKYNPYLFKKDANTSIWIQGVCNTVITFSLIAIESKQIRFYVFLFAINSIFIYTIILNFLCYKKIRDKKILLQTIIYIFLIILLCLLFALLFR